MAEIEANSGGDQSASPDASADKSIRLLQGIVEGTRVLLDAPDFEPALRDWLRMMCEAQGATSAAYYDIATHPDAGVETLRSLAEWSPYPPGEMGRLAISFAQPFFIDPRGAEALHAATARGQVVAIHAGKIEGPLRSQTEAQGHATTVLAPIMDGARCVGAVSFDYCRQCDLNPRDEVTLRTAADALAAVLKRNALQARLVAEQSDRAEENERLLAELQEVAAGSRRLVDAADFEQAMNDWLGAMGRAAGAARATFYDRVIHGESGLSTLRGLAEWTRPGVEGSLPLSFASPEVLDPRGAEPLMAASFGDEIVTFHTEVTASPMRAYLEAQGNATVLVVPIRLDGETRNCLSLDFLARREVGERERAVLQTAADAMASVLKRREAEAARLAAEQARTADAETAAALLVRRRDLLEAVVAASESLLGADRVDDAAAAVAARIGAALHADRVAVGRMLPPDSASAAGYMQFFAEWTSPGVPRQLDDPALTTFDMTHYPDFNARLLRGEAVQVLTAEITDAAGQAEQAATGALSQFQYPIIIDGALWGTIGTDDCQAPRQWDEAEIATLRVVASALASVVRRERLAEARLAAERQAAAERERAETARAKALLDERTRMAREIHDTLAQGFTGIILQGEAARAKRARGQGESAWEHLERSTALAKFGLSEARRSVLALRPLVLEKRGLVAALTELAARVDIPGVFTCLVQATTRVRRLGPKVEDALFRVVQEALTNALRHAAATRLDIALDLIGGMVQLTVKDDGVGFDPTFLERDVPGQGIVNLTDRVVALGGKLNLTSAPGQGTLITAVIPVLP